MLCFVEFTNGCCGSTVAAEFADESRHSAAGVRSSPDDRVISLYVNLLRYFQSVVNRDAQIPDGTIELRAPQQELDRPQILGLGLPTDTGFAYNASHPKNTEMFGFDADVDMVIIGANTTIRNLPGARILDTGLREAEATV